MVSFLRLRKLVGMIGKKNKGRLGGSPSVGHPPPPRIQEFSGKMVCFEYPHLCPIWIVYMVYKHVWFMCGWTDLWYKFLASNNEHETLSILIELLRNIFSHAFSSTFTSKISTWALRKNQKHGAAFRCVFSRFFGSHRKLHQNILVKGTHIS